MNRSGSTRGLLRIYEEFLRSEREKAEKQRRATSLADQNTDFKCDAYIHRLPPSPSTIHQEQAA